MSPACTDSYRSEEDSVERIPDSVESDVRKILDVRRGEFPDALLYENHGRAQVDDLASRKVMDSCSLPQSIVNPSEPPGHPKIIQLGWLR